MLTTKKNALDELLAQSPLVEKARSSDPRAAAELLELCAPLVSEMAMMGKRYLRLDIDDAAHEAVLGILEAARDFDARGGVPFRLWARRRISRQFYKLARQRRRQCRLAFDPQAREERGDPGAPELPASLGVLPEEAQLALRLHFGLDDVPHTDRMIGTRLGVSPSASAGLVRRALRLVQLMEGAPLKPLPHQRPFPFDPAALRSLSERSQELLRLHYGLDGHEQHTLEEIAILKRLPLDNVRKRVSDVMAYLHVDQNMRTLGLLPAPPAR